jgi:hypothetical protein
VEAIVKDRAMAQPTAEQKQQPKSLHNLARVIADVLFQVAGTHSDKLLIIVTFFFWFRLTYFPEYVALDAILAFLGGDSRFTEEISRWSYNDVVLPAMLFNFCCWLLLPGGTNELANFVLEFGVSCINYAEWHRLFLTPRGYSRVSVLLTRAAAVLALEYGDWRLLAAPEATHASVVGVVGFLTYHLAMAIDHNDPFHQLRMLSSGEYHEMRSLLGLVADETNHARRSAAAVHSGGEWLRGHPTTAAVAGLQGTVPTQAKLDAGKAVSDSIDELVRGGIDRQACDELLKCDAAHLVLFCKASFTLDWTITGIHVCILTVWFYVGLMEPLRLALTAFLDLQAQHYGYMFAIGAVLWLAQKLARSTLHHCRWQWAHQMLYGSVTDSAATFSTLLSGCVKAECDQQRVMSAICELIPRLTSPSRKACFQFFVDRVIRPLSERDDDTAWPPTVLRVLGIFARDSAPNVAGNFDASQRRAMMHGILAALYTEKDSNVAASLAATAGDCVRAHMGRKGRNVPAIVVVGAGTADVNGIYVQVATSEIGHLTFAKLFTDRLGAQDTPDDAMSIYFAKSKSQNVPASRWRMGKSGAKSYMCKEHPESNMPPTTGWEGIRSITKVYGKSPPPRVIGLHSVTAQY